MSVRMSVCMSRQSRLGGNVIFSAPNWDIAPIIFVQIPLINEHIFCNYFFSLSVGNATKGFATYGCCHPCWFKKAKMWIVLMVGKYMKDRQKISTISQNIYWNYKFCIPPLLKKRYFKLGYVRSHWKDVSCARVRHKANAVLPILVVGWWEAVLKSLFMFQMILMGYYQNLIFVSSLRANKGICTIIVLPVLQL